MYAIFGMRRWKPSDYGEEVLVATRKDILGASDSTYRAISEIEESVDALPLQPPGRNVGAPTSPSGRNALDFLRNRPTLEIQVRSTLSLKTKPPPRQGH